MDNYNRILNEIKSDIQKENIISDTSIISLYDLYNILILKLKKLLFITDEKTVFKSKSIFSRDLCKKVFFNIDSKNMTMHIHPTNNDNDVFSISKQYNNENLNFSAHTESSKKYMKSFMNKHYDEVINVFSVIEEYSTLLNYLSNKMDISVGTDDYRFNMRVIHLGEIIISPQLVNTESLNYFNKNSILELLEDSKFELTKKISINVNELDEILQNIVNEYYIEENNTCKKC